LNLKSDFAVGTYTGDGNGTQAITGVGFLPKFVIIGRYNSGGAEAQVITTTELIANPFSVGLNSGSTFATHIASLDADGFTVDTNLNVNTGTYWWVALG
tara:strand:+ start:3486 stop:3782 length:297 start_codon:yes stop_codon:yes gene_type:complete